MSLNKKELCKLLESILDHTSSDPIDLGKHYSVKIFGGSDSKVTYSVPGQEPITLSNTNSAESIQTLTIVDEGYTALEGFIDECNKDEIIGEKVGRRAIEKQLEVLIRQWFGNHIDAKSLESDIHSALKYLREQVKAWTLYFSLENLVLEDLDDFNIGYVRLLPASTCRSDLKAKLFQHIDNSSSDTRLKQLTKINLDDQISAFYPTNATIAVLTVIAEESRLREVAEHTLGEVFGVLRGFTHLLFPRDRGCHFDLKGSLLRAVEGWVGISTNNERWTVSKECVGALDQYIISQENIKLLRQHAELDTLNNILGRPKKERTQLEQAIIVAVQWHGAAINALTPAEEFVWHTVSLERLLISDGEMSTTRIFSDRLAWLLGKTGNERQYLATLASRLYDIRSRIVHAGETRVEAEYLNNIDHLASRAVIALTSRTAEWSRQDEMAEWVGKQLLGV